METITMMRLLGRSLLAFIRTFHYWHEHHLEVSLALLILGTMGFLIRSFGFLSAEWASFPTELEHALGIGTVVFFGLYLLLISVGKTAARFWPPPVVPILTEIPKPARKPATGHWTFADKSGVYYRFRYATTEDLACFTSLAMADPAIVLTYSFLNKDEWQAVYERWQKLQRESLMVLEQAQAKDHSWKTVAVSIVVPLSKTGMRALWTGSIGTAEIAKEHICAFGHKPSVLLLDLVASDRRVLTQSPVMILALPKVHLARYSTFVTRRKMEIWIEPVHRALPKILTQVGFEGPHKTSDTGHTIYKLALPLVQGHLSERQKETSDRIIENLRECAKWHIE